MSEMPPVALIAGSNLISFMGGVSRQEKKDVSDLLRYADFFAGQTYDRNEHWNSWIDYYRNRLNTYGCTLSSRILMTPMVITDPQELERIRVDVTGTTASASLGKLITKTFQQVRIDERARAYFQHGRGNSTLGTFQLVGCEKTDAGEILILLCALHANAYAEVDILGLTERVQRDIVMHFKGGVYTFDRNTYALNRQMISSKLRNITRLAIKDVEL